MFKFKRDEISDLSSFLVDGYFLARLWFGSQVGCNKERNLTTLNKKNGGESCFADQKRLLLFSSSNIFKNKTVFLSTKVIEHHAESEAVPGS